jgi:hypothetical protein
MAVFEKGLTYLLVMRPVILIINRTDYEHIQPVHGESDNAKKSHPDAKKAPRKKKQRGGGTESATVYIDIENQYIFINQTPAP